MYIDQHTKLQVCIKMRKFIMFITAVCVLFLGYRDLPELIVTLPKKLYQNALDFSMGGSSIT